MLLPPQSERAELNAMVSFFRRRYGQAICITKLCKIVAVGFGPGSRRVEGKSEELSWGRQLA
nr:hypothetical protein [Bradyrhizobium canariense]